MKLRTIKTLYDELNQTCFHARLVRPIILITRNKRIDGLYTYGGNVKRNFISINPVDGEVRATLFHEMVHQYVEEYLGLDDNQEHGDLFWLVYYTFCDYTFEWEIAA